MYAARLHIPVFRDGMSKLIQLHDVKHIQIKPHYGLRLVFSMAKSTNGNPKTLNVFLLPVVPLVTMVTTLVDHIVEFL